MAAKTGESEWRLDGRCVVVTGASSGIGRRTAIELASAGAHVIVHAGHSRNAAESVAAEIRELGQRAWVIVADLRRDDGIEKLIRECDEFAPRVDGWVNNAGADILTGDADHMSFEEKLAELFAVDVRATMLLGRAIGHTMRERARIEARDDEDVEIGDGGAIVNVGWDQADTGMEGDSGELFAATKGAVMAFTRSLSLSLAPEVRVNCVAPGWIRTAWGETAPLEWQERAVHEAPLSRWGDAADVARAIRFLLAPASGFVTGQILRVGGGAVR